MTTGCYMCDENTVLDSKKSNEHIIPQSLGSPLSRFDILCEAHNNDLGGKVDSELFRQIGHFADMLGVNKQNKKKILIGFDSENKSYTTTSGLKGALEVQLKLEGIKEEPIVIKINGHTEDEVRKKAIKAIQKYSKVYPDFEKYIDQLNQAEFTEIRPSGNYIWLKNEMTQDPKMEMIHLNQPMITSLIKIAVNYYIYNNCNSEYIQNLIDLMKSPLEDVSISNPQIVRLVAPSTVQRVPDKNEISHVLTLKGNQKEGYLVTYIELFCYLRIIVFMNLSYTGPEIEFNYGYDLLKKSNFNPDVKINISKNDMLNLQFNNDNADYLSANLERLYNVFNEHRTQNKNHINPI